MKIKKEVKVGIFSFVGIVTLIVGYNFLKGYDFLKGHNKYYVVYQNVDGIVKSTQVTINGLSVGQVEKIGMLHKGDPSQILVTMMINSDIQLLRGTKATIASQDLLGTKVISVVPGGGTTEVLQDGDTLDAGVEQSITSAVSGIVTPLKEKTEKVLATLDRMLVSINDVFDSSGTQKLANGINDLSGSLHHIRNMTERLDQLTADEAGRLKSILANVESIMHNLSNSNGAITKTLKNLSLMTDSLAASNLTSTVNNANNALREFSTTLAKINRGEGSLGKLANDKELYDNLNKTSLELNALMKDMQEYPGRYFSVTVFGGSKRAEKQDKKREEDKAKKKP